MDNFKKFKHFLSLYGRFLQCDLLHSLDENPNNPKNINIIILFRDTLSSIYAIDADDSENQLSPLFFSLKQTLKSYIEKNQYNTINLELYKIENNSKIFKEFNDSDFKKIFQEFIVSCEA
ncbi:hypothetical protein EI565_05545, partial [Campylobacter jejuni]|nr:hypothetical protein [Campylobacter jejuni]